MKYMVLILLIIIIVIVAICISYFTTLVNLLKAVKERNRTLEPSAIWFCLIPIFGVFFHLTVVSEITKTLRNEFKERGWKYDSNFGELTGKILSFLNIILCLISVFLVYQYFELPTYYNNYWNRDIVYLLERYNSLYKISNYGSLISLLLWIVYWVTISNYKRMLIVPSNGYQMQGNSNHEKVCVNCNNVLEPSDNFCPKCGGSEFTSAEIQNAKKLLENVGEIKKQQSIGSLPAYEIKPDEKECPKCKLILKNEEVKCNFCNYAFYGGNTTIVQDTSSHSPFTDKSTSNNENNKPKTNSKTIKRSILIMSIVIGVGAGVYECRENLMIKKDKVNENIEKHDDSTTNVLRNDLEAKERLIDSIKNLQDIEDQHNNQKFKNSLLVIQRYFDDISNEDFDAWQYFGNNVRQYISLRNVTPEAINESYQRDKKEYTNQKFYYDLGSITLTNDTGQLRYFAFDLEYRCYRTSREQYQVSKMTAEFIINTENKIVSLRYPKINQTQYYNLESEIPPTDF